MWMKRGEGGVSKIPKILRTSYMDGLKEELSQLTRFTRVLTGDNAEEEGGDDGC